MQLYCHKQYCRLAHLGIGTSSQPVILANIIALALSLLLLYFKLSFKKKYNMIRNGCSLPDNAIVYKCATQQAMTK
jgi:hypothetical protein